MLDQALDTLLKAQELAEGSEEAGRLKAITYNNLGCYYKR